MKELSLKATLANVRRVTDFIDEQLKALDCSRKAQMQIDVAIDELFANIARYAFEQDTGEASIRFDFDERTQTASVTFIHGGVPFDPLERPDPDVTLPAHAREIGGLGIFLVKRTMDRLEYRFENGLNILTLRKRI